MNIKVVGTPVVYTNNAGGGPDELQAPAQAEAVMQLDAGVPVLAAWFAPLDNISDLPAIHHIACQPNGTTVDLIAGGEAGQRDARVRLTVYAAVGA